MNFKANGCNQRLDLHGYIEENERPFCRKCYEEEMAYSCAKCGLKIIGVISFLVISNECNLLFRTLCMRWIRPGTSNAFAALFVTYHFPMESFTLLVNSLTAQTVKSLLTSKTKELIDQFSGAPGGPIVKDCANDSDSLDDSCSLLTSDSFNLGNIVIYEKSNADWFS